MSKIAIVFWSGTGNTEAMAHYIADGVRAGGGEAELFSPRDFSARQLASFSAVAFGCPAMGGEVLEEEEFEPMFSALENALSGKNIALFGSYGWGDGGWMRDWCARCWKAGANLLEENGLMVNETPDAEGEENCKALGRRLAVW